MEPTDAESREERFERLYRDNWRAVLSYASRRLRTAVDAEDAAAETFVVAWRRLDDVPEGHPAQLWCLGVCRRVIANTRRSQGRRQRLIGRLTQVIRSRQGTPGAAALGDVMGALAALSEQDQEVLRLVAWDGLAYDEAAKVLDITPNAVGLRVRRARQRLAAALAEKRRDERFRDQSDIDRVAGDPAGRSE